MGMVVGILSVGVFVAKINNYEPKRCILLNPRSDFKSKFKVKPAARRHQAKRGG